MDYSPAIVYNVACTTYQRRELLDLCPGDVIPSGAVRKAIFSHRLWQPCHWARPCKQQWFKTIQRQYAKCKHDRESRRKSESPASSDLFARRPSPEYTSIGLLNARSVGNKYAAICSRIASSHLDLCAVVETWHESANSPDLIACAPPGYSYLEKARPRTASATLTTASNHGGVCLFYASTITARPVSLPAYKSGLEVLAVYIKGSRHNAVVIVLYWPGSITANNSFFDDLDDIFERTATFACPVIALGDLNIHLDITSDSNTVKFQSLLDNHGLLQHVSTATHKAGHLLDVLVTRSDCPVTALHVEPPILSDHSFITADINLQFGHGLSSTTIRRRIWRNFNFSKFCDDLDQSVLIRDPPDDAASLFTCYNDTLQALVDKHAPFGNIKLHAHANAPWYDGQCQAVKV